MTKTANTDGQLTAVTVTIGSGPLSESVKKEIDAMATSKDCAKNFCNFIGGWLDGSNLDAEMVYFKNKLSTATNSATTFTSSSDSVVNTIGLNSGFNGDRVIFVCRHPPLPSVIFSEEYRFTVNEPPLSGSAGPRYCAKTIFPCL